MRLITQCPACATMFKVVPDQLRVSDGWVRCGQCDEVFDAPAHMQVDVQVDLQVSTSPAVNPETAHPDTASPATASPLVEPGASEATPPTAHRATAANPSMPVEAAFVTQPPAPEEERLATPGVEFGHASAKQPAAVERDMPLSDALPDGLTEPVPEPPEDDPLAITDVEPKPSFMHTAAQRKKPVKPLQRAILAVLCTLLGFALMLQVLLQEHDRIVAHLPQTRPLLTTLCLQAGCQIVPLRQIDSVVIDSSSFVKIRDDVYQLNVTLKNTAPIGVATPALELSLTNLQDQPVVRRVLLTTDFAPGTAELVPGREFSLSQPLQVSLPADADKISGYRLLAFYP